MQFQTPGEAVSSIRLIGYLHLVQRSWLHKWQSTEWAITHWIQSPEVSWMKKFPEHGSVQVLSGIRTYPDSQPVHVVLSLHEEQFNGHGSQLPAPSGVIFEGQFKVHRFPAGVFSTIWYSIHAVQLVSNVHSVQVAVQSIQIPELSLNYPIGHSTKQSSEYKSYPGAHSSQASKSTEQFTPKILVQ